MVFVLIIIEGQIRIAKFIFSKPLKNTKMGDKLLSIPYFDKFDFQCTSFSKNAPKF